MGDNATPESCFTARSERERSVRPKSVLSDLRQSSVRADRAHWRPNFSGNVDRKSSTKNPAVVPHPLHAIAPPAHPFSQSPPAFSASPFAPPMHSLPLGVTHHVHTPAPVQVQTLPALDTLRTASAPVQTPTAAGQSPMEQRSGGAGPQIYPPVPQAGRGFMSPWGQGPLGPLSPGGIGVQMHPSHPPPHQQQTLEPKELSTSSFPAEEQQTSFPPIEPALEPVEAVTELILEPPIDQSSKYSVSSPTTIPQTATSPISATNIEPVASPAREGSAEQVYEPTISASSTEEPTLSATTESIVPSPSRIAPWATPQKNKDNPTKSAPLSLKQIQEMEAKRAAEQARRIAVERAALAAQAPAATVPVVQQGLPQGSTWGAVAAKGRKPATVNVSTTAAPGKKTMAQIQKEEEEERTKLAKAKEVVPGVGAAVRGYASAASATFTTKVFAPIQSWGLLILAFDADCVDDGWTWRPSTTRPADSQWRN